jgi:hypothetical protein
MPSKSLGLWQGPRRARLLDLERQCLASINASPPQPDLGEENLRACVSALASHFQGFCRELHSECIEVLTLTLPVPIAKVFKRQCYTSRQLDGANARYESIRQDFERFDFDLNVALATDPSNANRITLLGHLNLWRNFVAHDKETPPLHGGAARRAHDRRVASRLRRPRG